MSVAPDYSAHYLISAFSAVTLAVSTARESMPVFHPANQSALVQESDSIFRTTEK